MSVLQLGYLLASNLQQQADARQAPVDGSSAGLQLQQVLLVQRLGVCGNGLCEVGERALLNAAGEAIKEADAPCPQVGQQMARSTGSAHMCSTCLCTCSGWDPLRYAADDAEYTSCSMYQFTSS
jgi:hypothetical protein